MSAETATLPSQSRSYSPETTLKPLFSRVLDDVCDALNNYNIGLREFVGMYAGINETIIYSRYGGNENKALKRRTVLIGSFVGVHRDQVDPKKFGRDMRRVIAIMRENPHERMSSDDILPITKPLGISRG